MRNIYGLLPLFTATFVVYAQSTSTSRRDTGFGTCAQCVLLGNEQVLQSCSQMWRDIVELCYTPECASQYSISIDTKTCTNTPPPLPGATGTTYYTNPFQSESLTTRTATTSASMTTSASATTSNSATTSASNTTSASGTTSASATTSASGTTSRSGSSRTASQDAETTRSVVIVSTSESAGTFSQSISTAGAAIGVVPRWVEGFVFVAGWVFAL